MNQKLELGTRASGCWIPPTPAWFGFFAAAFMGMFGSGCAGERSHQRTEKSPQVARAAQPLLRIELEAGERPAALFLPRAEAPAQGWPLVIALHGYQHWGPEPRGVADYLGLKAAIAEHQDAALLVPSGSTDAEGKRFWAASPSCCDMHAKEPDDVGYLQALLDKALAAGRVDADRVSVIGHSNGGFMAYRLACEGALPVAALASVAGAGPDASVRCAEPPDGSRPRMLHIHGDADEVVLFDGDAKGIGKLPAAYPGAEASLLRWAEAAGCATTDADGTVPPAWEQLEARDLTAAPGTETSVQAWSGCGPDERHRLQLWRMNGEKHVPAFSPSFAKEVLEFLTAPSPSTSLPRPSKTEPGRS